MSHPIQLKERAISLRKKGYSYSEISQKINIAKSTASEWLSSVTLDGKALSRLKSKNLLGQYNSIQTAIKKRAKRQELINKIAFATISKIPGTKEIYKLVASILFWTKGGKSTNSYVYFMNSDPKMIALFVYLLRSSFTLDETKFRAMMHIHEYHDEKKQLEFWSKIINIPASQFSKSYLKPHTGHRIRLNYQGCVRIRYYDTKIALELRSLYNTYVKNLGI